MNTAPINILFGLVPFDMLRMTMPLINLVLRSVGAIFP
jgi:hypothetical protein